MTTEAVAATEETFDDLKSLLAWVWAQGHRLGGLAARVGELHEACAAGLAEQRRRLEEAYARFSAALEAGGGELAPWLTERLAERATAVRAAQSKRLEELRAQLQELTAARARVEEQHAADREEMAAATPEPSAREQELAAEAAAQAEEIAKLDRELAQAAAGVGRLLRAGRILNLRAARQRWETARFGALSRLDEARRATNDRQGPTQSVEGSAQDQWRAQTARVAQLASERQSLEQDFEGICRRALYREIAGGVQEFAETGVPAADDALQAALAERAAGADLEAGLAAIARVRDLLAGVREGLNRFALTVVSLKEEQDMHAELKHVRLVAPAAVLEFHQAWEELLPGAPEAAGGGLRPAELGAQLIAILGPRLDRQSVTTMFEALGACLTEAISAQWD